MVVDASKEVSDTRIDFKCRFIGIKDYKAVLYAYIAIK